MSLADFKLDKTPVQAFEFRGHQLFIKRDDLLHPSFSGNKARKFRYFLDHDFPGIKRLIGYGSAQANSLYSMAALAELKGWQLDFYVDHLPEWLQQQPLGNYRAALELGARVIAVKNTPKAELMTGMTLEDFVRQHIVPECEHSLFVPEGVAVVMPNTEWLSWAPRFYSGSSNRLPITSSCFCHRGQVQQHCFYRSIFVSNRLILKC